MNTTNTKLRRASISLGGRAWFAVQNLAGPGAPLETQATRITEARAASGSPASAGDRRLLLLSVVAVILACSLALAAAHPAYAQAGGGGGDAVGGAIQKAITWISGLMIGLGTLGFLISVCIKAVAGTNEGRHAMAHMGMAGAAIAVVAGLLAPSIIQIFAGFAGH